MRHLAPDIKELKPSGTFPTLLYCTAARGRFATVVIGRTRAVGAGFLRSSRIDQQLIRPFGTFTHENAGLLLATNALAKNVLIGHSLNRVVGLNVEKLANPLANDCIAPGKLSRYRRNTWGPPTSTEFFAIPGLQANGRDRLSIHHGESLSPVRRERRAGSLSAAAVWLPLVQSRCIEVCTAVCNTRRDAKSN